MSQVDLHLHTTASDGRHSPEELVAMAALRSLRVIAITDHDSTEGIEAALKAARAYAGLRVIPGIEISTDIPHGEVHILGYFIDYQDEELQTILTSLREARLDRAKKIVAKLEKLGIRIDMKRVLELSGGGSIGRPHIAQAMFEGKYIPSLQEAFLRYIGRNGPAYAERHKLTPSEAVELIVKKRGLPVLAHPADIEPLDKLERLLLELKKVGMVGLEVYYNGYTLEATRRLEGLARKHGLIPCGGSDYHGLQSDKEGELGGVDVPMESALRLIQLAGGGAAALWNEPVTDAKG